MTTGLRTTGLRLYVADLAHRAGSRRDVRLDASHLDGMAVSATILTADEPLIVDVTLERIADGIVVRGRITGAYEAPCASCLVQIAAPLRCAISELFESDPIEGETYRLDDTEIDLEPVVRDAVLPALPVAPRCRDDCAGLCPSCGVDRNVTECGCEGAPPDARWDALAELRMS